MKYFLQNILLPFADFKENRLRELSVMLKTLTSLMITLLFAVGYYIEKIRTY